MGKIKIGIVGYGNLGRGAELAIKQNHDMELAGVFTRRDPKAVSILTDGVGVYHLDTLSEMEQQIDVLLLCGGSATDLPALTPKYAEHFNLVDSFDTHAKIPQHFARVDKSAKKGRKVAIISVGWDPGLFSVNRVMAQAIQPEGATYTFWGKGVSQGHSDAVRRVEGVADARQYTIPIDTALDRIRSGETPALTAGQRHVRVCYVVAKEGADRAAIEQGIITMPDYFADYDTTVHFISQQQLKKDHSGLPHGGLVIHTSRTGENLNHNQQIEYNLKLDSNPEFTASVMIAYARAAVKMAGEGQQGCKTVYDVPPGYLINLTPEELRKKLL